MNLITTRKNQHSLTTLFAAAGVLALTLVSTAGRAEAQLITNNPNLPPAGEYVGADALVYSAFGIISEDLTLGQFTDPILTPLPGGDELQEFFAVFAATETGLGGGAIQLTGPVQTIATSKTGNTTGTFSVEVISMDMSGIVGLSSVVIRESPTLGSAGETTITDLGGGLYQIDSFFDVFTEISVDGSDWVASDGPTRMTLVPEPSSLALLGLGGLVAMRRRRG